MARKTIEAQAAEIMTSYWAYPRAPGAWTSAQVSSWIGNSARRLLACYDASVATDHGSRGGRIFMDSIRGHLEGIGLFADGKPRRVTDR